MPYQIWSQLSEKEKLLLSTRTNLLSGWEFSWYGLYTYLIEADGYEALQ